jgi:hypothetical protein
MKQTCCVGQQSKTIKEKQRHKCVYETSNKDENECIITKGYIEATLLKFYQNIEYIWHSNIQKELTLNLKLLCCNMCLYQGAIMSQGAVDDCTGFILY